MSDELKRLFDQVRDLVLSARQTAARNINTLHVFTCFEIGRLIMENEQAGSRRAEYGKMVLANLSRELTAEFGRGYSKRNLESMRRFYQEYRSRLSSVSQKASGESSIPLISLMAGGTSPGGPKAVAIAQKASAQFRDLFALSWSHYVFLMAIPNPDERQFYEIEAADNGWSLPELKRQFNSGLYERFSLSRDKGKIKELAEKGQRLERPEDMLKHPYVLEFLGLDEKSDYSESDLETAIIGKLEHFLLELGKGFLFEARQKRFTFDADHYFVDLVFYNRLLRCYVLIDLKIGKLIHQDLGQMQMYVNYFDRHVKTVDENPTVGIILCKMKNDALVELTLPKNAKVYTSQYQLYLPSKEELKRKLIEWATDCAMEADEG